MNSADHLIRLLRYDAWANREALESIRNTRLHRSRKLLAHIVAAESMWIRRLNGDDANDIAWPEWSIEECAAQMELLQAAWRDLLPHRHGERFTFALKGKVRDGSVADVVLHVVLHASYHRGQMALDQRTAGHAPPLTDYVDCLRSGWLD